MAAEGSPAPPPSQPPHHSGTEPRDLFHGVWQQPHVDIFKSLGLGGASLAKAQLQGDVVRQLDRTIGKTVFVLRGVVPAANFLLVPSPAAGASLGLTGRYCYLQILASEGKFFALHIDVNTKHAPQSRALRVSLSNLFQESRVVGRVLQVPLAALPAGRWAVVAIDLAELVLRSAGSVFVSLRALHFCSSLCVRTVLTSDQRLAPATLPRELHLPVPKGAAWEALYAWLWVEPESVAKAAAAAAAPSGGFAERAERENLSKVANASLQPRRALGSPPLHVPPPRSPLHVPSEAAEELAERLASFNVSSSEEKGEPAIARSSSSVSVYSVTGARRPGGRPAAAPANEPLLTLQRVVGATPRASHNVMFDASGREAIFACENLVVAMDLASGRQRVFSGHTAPVTTLALAESGQLLASAQEGQFPVVRVWDVERAQCLAYLMVHSRGVSSLSFSWDSRLLSASGRDRQGRWLLVVWDVSDVRRTGDAAPVAARQISDFPAQVLRFAPLRALGERLVSCGRESVRFWRMRHGHLPGASVALLEHGRGVDFADVAFEREMGAGGAEAATRRVFVAASNGAVLQINATSCALEYVYELHAGPIHALAVHDAFCVTASGDRQVRVWPLDFSDFHVQAEHQSAAVCASVSRDGLRVLVGAQGGSVGVLDLPRKDYKTHVRSHTGAITAVAVDPCAARAPSICTSASDGTIRVWDQRSLTQVFEFASEREVATALAVSPVADAHLLACGFDSGAVRVCDVPSVSVRHELRQHVAAVTALAFSADGAKLFSCAGDGAVCVCDALRGFAPVKMVPVLASPPRAPASAAAQQTLMAVSAAASLLAAVTASDAAQGEACAVSVFDFSTPAFKAIARLAVRAGAEAASITALAFAPAAPELLVLVSDGRVLRFNARSGALLTETTTRRPAAAAEAAAAPGGGGAATAATCLAVSPGGRLAVAGGPQAAVEVWEYASTRVPLKVQSFAGHFAARPISALAFARDGILVSCAGPAMFVWQTRGDAPAAAAAAASAASSAGGGDEAEEKGGDTRGELDEWAVEDAEVDAAAAAAAAATATTASDAAVSVDAHFLVTRARPVRPRPRAVPPRELSVLGLSARGARRNAVWSVGARLLVYTSGSLVVLEHLATGAQTLLEAPHECATLALSQDGSLLASGAAAVDARGGEAAVVVWRLASGERQLELSGRRELRAGVQALCFDESGRVLMVASRPLASGEACALSAWAVDARSPLAGKEGLVAALEVPVVVFALRAAPSGGMAFTAACNGGFFAASIREHAIAWRPARPQTRGGAAAAASGGLARQRRFSMSGRPEEIERGAATSCDVNAAGEWAVGYASGQVAIFSHSLHLLHTLQGAAAEAREGGGECAVDALAWLSEAALLVASSSRSVRCFAVSPREELLWHFELDGRATAAAFALGRYMGVVATEACSLWFVNAHSRELTRLVSSHASSVSDLAVDDAKGLLVSCSVDGSTRLWPLGERGAPRQGVRFQVDGAAALSLSLDASGALCAVGYSDGCVRFLHVESLQLKGVLALSKVGVTAVSLDEQSGRVRVGTEAGELLELDSVTRAVLQRWELHLGARVDTLHFQGGAWLACDSLARLSVFSREAPSVASQLLVAQVECVPKALARAESAAAAAAAAASPAAPPSRSALPCAARFSPRRDDVVIVSVPAASALRFFDWRRREWLFDVPLEAPALSLAVASQGQLAVGGVDGVVAVFNEPADAAAAAEIAERPLLRLQHREPAAAVALGRRAVYSGSFCQILSCPLQQPQ